MSPQLAAVTRQQLPQLKTAMALLGALQSVTFTGVGPDGADIYHVKFGASASRQYLICRFSACMSLDRGTRLSPVSVHDSRTTVGLFHRHCVLSLLAGLLLIIFQDMTDRMIPLFAVGAFTAFTLSQAGMVVHWKRHGGPGARSNMLVNCLGPRREGALLARQRMAYLPRLASG